MSLIQTLTIDANERVSFDLANSRRGRPDTYDCYIYGGGGNDFGSGTVTIQVSPDNGTTWIDATDTSGTAATADADKVVKIEANSDPKNPVILGFNMAGSTAPTVTIKVFDSR